MNISEKVAYLKGLAVGIEVSSDTKEGRLLTGILDVLGDIAKSLRDSDDAQVKLWAYSEELDEDLGVLEKAFLKRHGQAYEPDEFYDDDDEYECFGDLEGAAKLNCPDCGGLLLFDLDDIKESGSVNCPECGAEISVVGQFSSEGGGCAGAGCGGCGEPAPEQTD